MTSKATSSKRRGLEDSAERLRRSRRNIELEEIRRNALAAKRSLKVKRLDPSISKSTFIKTLGQFSDARKDIENAIQSQGTLLNREVRPKIIEDRILTKPLRLEGFLRAGIKGRKIKRHPSDEKFKEAVRNNDLLAILQSGGLSDRKQQQHEDLPVKPVNNHVEAFAKSQIKNILKNSYNPNRENQTPNERMFNCSLELGGTKGKKTCLSEIAADWSLPSLLNDSSKTAPSPIIKQAIKEDRCKRRLFDNENQHVNDSKIPDLSKTRSSNSDCKGNSIPANGIYFAEYTPQMNMDDKKEINYKIKPSDTHLMSAFLKTSKAFAEVEFKHLFLENFQDPVKAIKTTLKSVYTNTYNNYLQKQKERSVERSSLSSNSEVMKEPDSDIARILKKNDQVLSKKSILKNKSSLFLNDLNGEESNGPKKSNQFKNNRSKRKRVPSSKGDTDERVIPSSTNANANSDSAKLESSMDSLHPSRQELIARYLKDIDTSKALETENENEKAKELLSQKFKKTKGKIRHHLKKENVQVTDVNVESYIMLNKGAKHVPAILRKNRSQNDFTTRDEIVQVKEHPMSNKMFNKPFLDFGPTDNLENQFKPNCDDNKSNRLMEALKCKYVNINSEYNQSSMSGTFSQNKNIENNDGCRKRSVPIPVDMENKFSRNVNFEVSPIKQLNVQNDLDYHQYRLSQENQGSNCMTRIISFGDIQEKTNRLTLHSSQSQHCSQESSEHKHNSIKDHYYGANPDCYERYQPPNNHAMYNYQPCRTLVEIPSSQPIEPPSSQNYRCYPPRISNYLEKQPYVVEQTYELVPSVNFSSQQSEDFDYYQQDNHIACGKSIPLQYQQGPVNAVPLHHLSQPSKFFGVEENKMPQRRPVYNPKDINHCSFTHRQSVPSQQFTKLLRVPFSRSITNDPGYSISSMGFKSQDPQQTVCSPDFEYDYIQFGNVIDSEVKSSEFSSEISAPNRNINNYVPNNSSQSFAIQQNAPVYTGISNQRYSRKRVQMQRQMQMPSPLSSQVEYQDNCYSNTETRRINDDYFHHMHYNNHKKRP